MGGASEAGGASEVGGASKRSMTSVFEELRRRGLASESELEEAWVRIKGVVSKTCVAIHPFLLEKYSNAFSKLGKGPARADAPEEEAPSGENPSLPRTCFHIVGVDLLLDSELRPWLIEINHNPSLTCDTPFDLELKGGLIASTIELLCLEPFDKRSQEHRRNAARWRQRRREKGTTTPLEREHLQQQRLRERRKEAIAAARQRPGVATSGAPSSAAAPSAAHAAAPSAAPTADAGGGAVESAGLFERAVPSAGVAHERWMLFSSPILHRKWRAYRGVRTLALSAVSRQSTETGPGTVAMQASFLLL